MKWSSQYRLVALVAFDVLAGCTGNPIAETNHASKPEIRIVAVERVYGDLARQLGGSGIDVTTILNSPSADPHSYEPTARDAEAVAGSDIVIENGLGYDAFVDKLVAASPKAGRTIIDVGSLAAHRIGDNPHVWYECKTLRLFTDVLARAFVTQMPMHEREVARRRKVLDMWIDSVDARIGAIAKTYSGKDVAITEPVFDYVLRAAHLNVATPASFSHAIEEGNDPAPQDVERMRALLAGRNVAAFVYNDQTIEPATTQLLAVARAAHVTIVPVTETLPAGQTAQTWIDGEIERLRLAL